MAVHSHRLYLLAAVVLLSGVTLTSSPAQADECSYVEEAVIIDGQVQVTLVEYCDGATSGTPSGESVELPPRDSGLDAVCVSTAIENGVDPFEFCDIPPEYAEEYVTPGLVAAAFREIPLPASELRVQPANGRTLVNFATNFYTETAPFDRTVTLLGQQVDLRIVPSEFAWRFGDGEVLTTEDAGAPYPDLRVTHDYRRQGPVRPAVDTTYTATYRVNGGPWAAVPGSVTIPGDTVSLQVLTASPLLVGS
jgi:hypothetical protein